MLAHWHVTLQSLPLGLKDIRGSVLFPPTLICSSFCTLALGTGPAWHIFPLSEHCIVLKPLPHRGLPWSLCLNIGRVLALFPVIRGSLLRTEPVFLHTKNIFLIFLKKGQHIPDTGGGHKGSVCLSLSSSENALAFFLETALMPEGHKTSRDLKTMTAFGFWPLLFPLCALYLFTLTHEQTFEPL